MFAILSLRLAQRETVRKPRPAERPMQITALLAAWSGSEMAVHSSTSSHVIVQLTSYV